MLYVTTVNDFTLAWARLQAFFATQPAIIQYLQETCMPVVEDWAACYTNRNPTFGHRTTSPVKSANRYLKSFLIRGSSTVKQVVEQLFEMVKKMEENIREARQYQKNHLRRDYLEQKWLGDTPVCIALRAIELITIERRYIVAALPSRLRLEPTPLAPCIGQFTTQFGMPCWHELLRRHEARNLVL